jgi:hypothetical protein
MAFAPGIKAPRTHNNPQRHQRPSSRRGQKQHGAAGKNKGKGVYMYEKFHYLIISLFVPALPPVCPRFVPGSHSLQTRMNPGFCYLSPVSPPVLCFPGRRDCSAGVKNYRCQAIVEISLMAGSLYGARV